MNFREVADKAKFAKTHRPGPMGRALITHPRFKDPTYESPKSGFTFPNSRSLENRRLPHGEGRGNYEISVPGGGVVLKGDVRRLQVYLAAEGEQLLSESGLQREILRDPQASCGERHSESRH